MRIYSLKRTTIPKIAVLATGLTAAILAATINPAPAQAEPSFGVTCTGCHTAGGSVTATPSSPTVAPGAAYTVAIVITNAASGNSGYNISLAGASVLVGAPAAGKTFSAAMTAPAAAGPYTYNVGADTGAPPGAASATTYTITVGATTTTTPPPTTTTTTPPPSIARIRVLSPRHGDIGTKVTIHGSGFGTLGAVQFGTVAATASSWTDTKIVFEVPDGIYAHVVPVTVTPMSATASNAVNFRLDWDNHHGDDVREQAHWDNHHGDDAREQAPRHHVRHAGDFD